MTRWIAALFGIGSACFAAASIASQWASAPRPWIGVTFFAGSVFFTGGGITTYLASDAAGRRAALIQLAGTLFFNVSTFAAMKTGLDAKQSDLRVWTPDAFGSICFLVSSWMSYTPLRGARDRAWDIAALNLAGSVAFGISAITALVQPSTGEPVSAAIANATTTAGALCFLAGAVLLGRQTPSSSLTSQMSRATIEAMRPSRTSAKDATRASKS